MPPRTFDVVLFGPTGVTGREVARYLSARAPELGLTWAVAGRDRDRMTAALDAVEASPDGTLLADTSDASSIGRMVSRARVVANLVGPYARYGEVVHRACAEGGVHQLDLTGEIEWVQQMIGRYDVAATASGAAIVPTAGFEALPFDLAARLVAEAAYERHESPVVEIDAAVSISSTARVTRLADAVSGGTYASLVEMIRHGGLVEDAHALDAERSSGAGRDVVRPRRHRGTGAWLAPLPYLNPPVVHRSASLVRRDGDPVFAPSFQYREGTVVASMLPGPQLPGSDAVVSALATTGLYLSRGLGLLPAAAREGMADALARLGPSPGDGPRPEDLDAWTYRIDVRAVTASGATADARVDAEGHPGYKSTATLIGEAALAVAELDAPRPGYGTPSTVLGVDDLDRFAAAGASFTVRPPQSGRADSRSPFWAR